MDEDDDLKRTMLIKTLAFSLLLIVVIAAVGIWGISPFAQSAFAPAPTPEALIPQSAEEEAIRKAIQTALQAEMPEALALLLYDTQIEGIKVSTDGKWAIGWLVPLDPETGQVVPVEPGLALVRNTDQGWQAFIPSDPLWPLVIREMPDELVPPEQKLEWMKVADYQAAAVAAPIGGYYLPWAGGDTMSLTQSVGHDRYTPSGSAHFAFDFAKPGYPSGLFNVHAARGGTVKRAVWSHSNGDPVNGNYIVLEDTSTTPTTYQLYLHFAKDSIPVELRTIGTHVRRGQFIGVADDTGVSSGNHLHFMVHTTSTSYWGTSIDITFDDVSINGGRPRITSDLPYCRSSDVCDSTQANYVSANFMSPDHIAPTGGITSPPEGAIINSSVLPLQGYANDENSGIASAQFMALYNDEWHTLGSAFSTNPFSYNWDMCAANVPDGPVSLALTIRDKAQNQASGLPGLTHFSKNFECAPAPSACIPTANQAALFAGSDFQGRCILLNVGSYASPTQLGALGGDSAASVLVGSNVQASLFSENNYLGRGETFFSQDSSLTDNRIGAATVSSVMIQTRSTLPAAPKLVWPSNGTSIPGNASMSLSWDNASGAALYQLELSLNGSQVLLTPWVETAFWHLSALTPGNYTWRVKPSNLNGQGSWSSMGNFQITVPPASGQATVQLPYTETMESAPTSWTGTNWVLSNTANHTEGGALGWKYDIGSSNGYDNGQPNFGYLTSPNIQVPGSSAYYLRFYYQYETEGTSRHWDQRWVQISANGGPFTNVLFLSDDPPNYWLRSPAISLAQYAGQTIQVRFYFVTFDQFYNPYPGWYIDDLSITTEAPPACGDNNNTPAAATHINYSETVNGLVCPGGDSDYYQFQAYAGDRIGLLTQAQAIGSPLDTTISLIDTDGKSVLSSNDDIVQFERTDSSISYRILRTGNYYIKVQAWDHPNAGSANAAYTLSLYKDDQDPTASFISPQEGASLPSAKTMLNVAARDTNSGVALVRFYWHSNDWLGSNWNYLGEDWNPQDGWNFEFDTSTIPDRNGIAVFAVVFDWAGNWVGTGAWNLHPPMLYLPIILRPR